jgi:hypothetical protein
MYIKWNHYLNICGLKFKRHFMTITCGEGDEAIIVHICLKLKSVFWKIHLRETLKLRIELSQKFWFLASLKDLACIYVYLKKCCFMK